MSTIRGHRSRLARWAGVCTLGAMVAVGCRRDAKRGSKRGKPQRIVSTMVAADEVLLELVGEKRLQAVTRFTVDPDFSPVAKRARRIQGRIHVANTEAILKYKPDLVVLAAYARAEIRTHLKRVGVRVVNLDPVQSFAAIRKNIHRLGRASGERDGAAKLIHGLDRGLAAIRAALPRKKRVVSLLAYANGYVAGAGTSIDDIALAAGAKNLAGGLGIRGHTRVDPEVLWKADPPWILLQAPDFKAALALARRDNVLSRLSAVRAGRVLYLSQAHLASASHLVIYSVRSLFTQLHPQAAKAVSPSPL